MSQRSIPALYMRGGTSKGLFFRVEDLPADAAQRDALLLRASGSPDPYGKQIDGMGGATSSTSKVVILSRSAQPGCDVDYLFGAVAIERAVIDWSGSCGNLAAAVGPVAIHWGLVPAPAEGVATVRIWQVNTRSSIVARVPMRDGAVLEEGDFVLDGVSFPSAEIVLEFPEPGGGELFPTGRVLDVLEVPGLGRIELTLINAGNPAIFADAAALGLRGDETQQQFNADAVLLERCETLRAYATVAMGLAATPQEATALRPATPKLAFVTPPRAFRAADGRELREQDMDLCVRILSMGRLHHAMTGTGAVALAAAAAIPGTVVQRCAGVPAGGRLRFGHPSGSMTVAAEAERRDGRWRVARVGMSRSARRLMEGTVLVPGA
ncbi:MAG TPA: 2-methylaconitate cis-trans isomerase PrpF [Nevskia sp.]|nr:2-methylaconitate cis-trans isomerase PrpF [Nevskia sp.]